MRHREPAPRQLTCLHLFSFPSLLCTLLCTQAGSVFLGTFDFESEPFDWGQDDARPRKSLKDLIVYEMPVSAFSSHPRYIPSVK